MKYKNYFSEKYIDTGNGNIIIVLTKDEEYGDFSLTFNIECSAYPSMSTTLSAISLDHLIEINAFLNKEIAKQKLKSD